MDPHTPFLNRLAADGDWAGLCRYYAAHDWEPALHIACEMVRGLVDRHPNFAELARLLADPMRAAFERPPSKTLLKRMSDIERDSLRLLVLVPRFALLEPGMRQGSQLRPEFLAECRRAADEARELGRRLGDRAVVAKVETFVGRDLQTLNRLDLAREKYLEALRLYSEASGEHPYAYGVAMAGTCVNLGMVNRGLGNFAEARQCYWDAVDRYRLLQRLNPGSDFRGDIARAFNNLGNVERDLNDLEAACSAFQQALAIRDELAGEQPAEYLPFKATSLVNLGTAYALLERLNDARDAFQEGVEIYSELVRSSPEYLPDLAWASNNLGNVYNDLQQPEAALSHLERARGIYSALVRQGFNSSLDDVAWTLDLIGNARRTLGEPLAAVAVLNASLRIYSQLSNQYQSVYPVKCARVLIGLGAAQSDLGDWVSAKESFQRATDILAIAAGKNPTAYLRERQQAWSNLGQVLRREASDLGLPDYSGARQAFRKAVDCTEQFRGIMRISKHRKEVQERGLRAYGLLISTCLDLWDESCRIGRPDPPALAEAVTVAERSRSRNLIDRLHGADLRPVNAPPELVKAFCVLRAKLADARQKLQDEAVSAGGMSGGRAGVPTSQEAAAYDLAAESWAEVERLERELARQVGELRRYDPDFSSDGVSPLLSFEQIQNLIPSDMPTAFVQFVVTPEGGIALVTTRTEAFPVRLKALTDRKSSELARAWFEAYYDPSPERFRRWESKLPELLSEISATVVMPTVGALAGRGLKRLVVSPSRELHLFPLHACPVDGGYLDDLYEIVYTPSLAILGRCASRERPEQGPAVIVGNPTGNLRFTEAEGAALRSRFPIRTELWREEATKDRLFEVAGSSSLLHYSGHATFNPADQLSSGLLLSAGQSGLTSQLLTLREVFEGLNLRRNSLTVLNGCETGMVGPDLVDEYVTLPSGFLYAGAVCVVSTLWAVHDLSAALLMDRFYAERQSGKCVSAALRAAARWLREEIRDDRCLVEEVMPNFLGNVPDPELRQSCDDAARRYAARHVGRPPFESPIHWAAFIATGSACPFRKE